MLTKLEIEKYFIAEKQESLLFIVIGVAAIICAVVFMFFFKNNFWRGVAIPLIVVGLIQCLVGFTVYKRSDTDRMNNVYAFDMNPQQLQKKELPRMEVVNKKFVVYRWVEIALFLTAIFLIVKFKNNAVNVNSSSGYNFWYGFGIALAIQSFIMLGADYFAEKRATIYTKQLEVFVEKNSHISS